MKNILKSLLVLAFLVGVGSVATPARADNGGTGMVGSGFMSAQASFRAEALAKFDNAVGVILGSNSNVRVMGAKVTSVSGSTINATVPFGNSALDFVINTSADTKLNGKLLSDSSVLSNLKAGDSISFAGAIASSTSSSITVTGANLVSQALFSGDRKIEDQKTSFEGKISAINSSGTSLTLKLKSGVSVEVDTSTSTAISLDGATSILANLAVGDQVKVGGTLNASGTVITASKVSAQSGDKVGADNGGDKNGDNKDTNGGENKGGFWGKFMNWLWK